MENKKFEKAAYIFMNQLLKLGYQPEEIYGYGEEAVEFYIKELPGWTFGIWWKEDEKDENVVTGEFFTQYVIDKFKPSRSTYVAELWYNIIKEDTDDICCGFYDVEKILKFLKENKYLAFYSDLYWVIDYNTRKQQPVKAFFEYVSYHFKEWLKEKLHSWLNKKFINRITKFYIPALKEDYPEAKFVGVVDLNESGWTCHPRYELVAYFDKCPEETGTYDLCMLKKEKHWYEKRIKIAEKICFDFYDDVRYDMITLKE